jgi:tetratricopeptide (TPR) repeat protein
MLIAEQRRDFRAAIANYEKEIELYPRSYKSLYNLGMLHGYLGNRPAQLESYQHAIEVNPYFGEGYIALAKLYLDMEQNLEEAMTLARQGLEHSPQSEFSPMGHYVLADIYNRQGLPELAAREAARGRALEARVNR